MKLTIREAEILAELLKNAKSSDQDMARKLHTSRPTVAKIKKRLENKGLIRGYTVKTNFQQLGFHIHAITFFRWNDFSRKKEYEENLKFISSRPEVILFSAGTGLRSKTNVIISIHASLMDYEIFWKKLQDAWGQDVHDVEIFFSSIANIKKRYDWSDAVLERLKEASKA